MENELPGRSAVPSPVDAALVVGAVGVTERRDEDGVRVRGMDADTGDVPRLLEAEVIPGAAGIVRDVDAG